MPSFGGKKDAIPGFVNEFWFQADVPGTYRGQCAELCGRDHAFMPVVVEVLPVDEFTAWLAEQAPQATPAVARTETTAPASMAEAAAPAPTSQEAAPAQAAEPAAADTTLSMDALMSEGRNVHLTYCAACHQADGSGLPAAGFPALADIQVSLDEHIQVGLNVRPGTAMAAFGPQLTDEQLAAVITFQRNAFGNETGDTAQPADIAAAR